VEELSDSPSVSLVREVDANGNSLALSLVVLEGFSSLLVVVDPVIAWLVVNVCLSNVRQHVQVGFWDGSVEWFGETHFGLLLVVDVPLPLLSVIEDEGGKVRLLLPVNDSVESVLVLNRIVEESKEVSTVVGIASYRDGCRESLGPLWLGGGLGIAKSHKNQQANDRYIYLIITRIYNNIFFVLTPQHPRIRKEDNK